jgi:hypothetical protein
MLVECIVGFRDLDAGILRDAGDRFEVSPERFAALNGTKYGKLVSEVVSEVLRDAEKPARRTRTRKAKAE